MLFNWRLNLFTNLNILVSESFRFKVLDKICCNKSNTNPTPNSIAENIKKKKVKDSKLRLSKANPVKSTIEYKVIHKSSAVNNKCKAVLVFKSRLPRIKKKKKIKVFKSPKNKINKITNKII